VVEQFELRKRQGREQFVHFRGGEFPGFSIAKAGLVPSNGRAGHRAELPVCLSLQMSKGNQAFLYQEPIGEGQVGRLCGSADDQKQ
jgi:hypothetical protein